WRTFTSLQRHVSCRRAAAAPRRCGTPGPAREGTHPMKTHVRFCVAAVLTALSAGPAAAWAQDQPRQAAAEADQQPAQQAQEAPAPALQPAIASTLSAAPVRIDAGALGPLYVGGVLSGLGLAQS